ncbi:baculoviral IAP repeat-containing protein 7-like [Branchiostoma floridae x Branchiostoma belcheri]
MAQGTGPTKQSGGQDQPDLARDVVRFGGAEAMSRQNAQEENLPQQEIQLSVTMNRLASFSALLKTLLLSINVRKLANAGLYYPGSGNKLVCYKCNGAIDIEDWTDHNEPIEKHNKLYPKCPCSKALDVADGKASTRINGEYKTKKPKQERTIDSTDAGASNSKKTDTNDVRSCNSSCPKDLNTELHRLHTYYGYGWPMDTPVSPEQLAKLGFFYLGVRDKVECAFCGGVLHQWEQGDDPKVEHERHYPHCPFIRGYATSNVPLESSSQPTKLSPFIQQSSLPQSATAVSQSQQRSCFSQENEKTAKRKEPKHPELSSEEDRLSTFLRWPLYSPIPPRKLAQAGFYYTHTDDQVRCFWCDGGLKDWQAGDDPWTEHARWYGEECEFVLLQKTPSFVQDVKRRHPVLGQVRHEEKTFNQAFISNGPVSGACQQTVQEPPSESPSQALFQETMESPLIQNALEMGFERKQVEDIVNKQLKRHGRPFAKMTDIVEALLSHEKSQNSGEEDEEKKNNTVETTTQTTPQENPSESGAQASVPAPREAHGDEQAPPSDVISLQRQLQQMMEERMCKICMDERSCMVLIPCGHMCCCEGCVQMVRSRGGRCPVCRGRIQRVQKTFVA